jgi:CheY-like chemotaxis protein
MSTLNHTILYAEDDLDDLFILQQAFEKHDHIKVAHALDGKKAMQMLESMLEEKSLPCLVILDINMPVMNGREVLQYIRQHPDMNRLPVVLFSTSSSSSDKQFAETLNATLITKPVDFGKLEIIVGQFIERCDFEINKVSMKTD